MILPLRIRNFKWGWEIYLL